MLNGRIEKSVFLSAPIVRNCSLERKTCKLLNGSSFDCWHLPFLNQSALEEPCKQGYTYDYFWNSEVSYIATYSAIGAFVIGKFLSF